MAYVIKRVEDGKYVAQPGSEHSYTKRLEKALRFDTRDEAKGNACGNEIVCRLEDCFD